MIIGKIERSFLDKIKTLIKLIFEPRLLRALVFARHNGYLVDTGWNNSFVSKEPLDKNGKPIPWLTYPAISFLSDRLSINNDISLFEYGSGNSTIYYSLRVKKVIAVEHNKEWFDKIKNRLNKNAEIIFKEVDEDRDGDYSRTIKSTNEKFNIVIIDAEERVNCIKNCCDSLTEDGVIILDDSERKEYTDGIEFLSRKGFKRLDFYGIAAGIMYQKSTSIFYRKLNCLNI